MSEVPSMYERVGGERFFEELTLRFYDGVRADEVLRPLYPEEEGEFEAARLRLKWFLEQYWGGPATYQENRGHPRLRMRHVPFTIGTAERDAWFTHMHDAVTAASLAPADAAELLDYFAYAASALVNVAPGKSRS